VVPPFIKFGQHARIASPRRERRPAGLGRMKHISPNAGGHFSHWQTAKCHPSENDRWPALRPVRNLVIQLICDDPDGRESVQASDVVTSDVVPRIVLSKFHIRPSDRHRQEKRVLVQDQTCCRRAEVTAVLPMRHYLARRCGGGGLCRWDDKPGSCCKGVGFPLQGLSVRKSEFLAKGSTGFNAFQVWKFPPKTRGIQSPRGRAPYGSRRATKMASLVQFVPRTRTTWRCFKDFQ